MNKQQTTILAYVVGVALGDGNLSRPNKRATRLRVTCDQRYPEIAKEITEALIYLFPDNKVARIAGPRDTYFNISVYSNKLDGYLPWKVGKGTKIKQNASVPQWILSKQLLSVHAYAVFCRLTAASILIVGIVWSTSAITFFHWRKQCNE